MAVAFPVKPGKAQGWRDRGREFRGARRNEYLAFRRRWGLTVNRLYFQHTPQGDLAVFYLEGHDLQRAFQYLRTAQDPCAAWLRQHTLDLFEGFDLTNHHWKRSPSWPLMHRAWKMMKRGTAPRGRLVHEAHASHDSPVRGILQSRVGSMMILRLLAVIFGVALIVLVALDAFETIVLPRRVTRRIRLALIFYRTARLGWVFPSHLFRSGSRRDAFLGYVGPLSLLGLLLFWAVLFVFGFALLLWGLALPLNALDHAISFLTYLYLSGTTFFTLGLGDITPVPGLGRFLVVSEVAFGLVFLALVISYVPVIYQAFSRRELRISLLDARAGSPPTAVELLRRNSAVTHPEELRTLLHEWEVWLVRRHSGEQSLLPYPGLLPLAARAAILGGVPDRHPGYLRAHPDEPGSSTPAGSPLYLCSGASCRRRSGPGAGGLPHGRGEPAVNRRMDSGARPPGGRGHPFEGRHGR